MGLIDCWQLQEGPYDDDDCGFGSTSRNFDEVLDTVITGALEELPKHTLLFLNIYTRNHAGDAGDANDPENIGGISRDDIAAVLERVGQAASRRNLDFIGPARGVVIPMEISLGGLIGEAFSHAGETSDFLSEYVDQLLAGGDDDIANISHALLERYMELLNEDEDGLLLSALRDRFEEDIRALVLEKDIRPTVEDAAGQLQWTLVSKPRDAQYIAPLAPLESPRSEGAPIATRVQVLNPLPKLIRSPQVPRSSGR